MPKFLSLSPNGISHYQDAIKDLDFPAFAKIGGVIRGESGFVAHGSLQIQEGDKVVVFTLPSGIRRLEKFFKTT
jgi:trk system potassium uptake protein TrkA